MTISPNKILDANCVVVDQFCETIGKIEHIGPCRRLTFVTRSPIAGCYDVVVRMVLPAEALQDLAQMAAADSPMPAVFVDMPSDQLAN